MTYSKKILAQVGRAVLESQPHIAEPIVLRIMSRQPVDVGKIPGYYHQYCRSIEVLPDSLRGQLFERAKTEKVKVFISAMVEIYQDQPFLNKNLSQTLQMKESNVSRTAGEVKFRYKKDQSFKQKVDELLNNLK